VWSRSFRHSINVNDIGGWIAQAELLKLQKNGQFPDESVTIEDAQIHHVNAQTY